MKNTDPVETMPSGNTPDALPPAAREKFRRLEDEVAEYSMLSKAATDSYHSSRDDVDRIEFGLRKARQGPQVYQDHRLIEDLEKKLAAATETKSRREVQYRVRSEARQAKQRVFLSLKTFVESGGTFKEAPAVKLPASKKSLIEQLDEQRKRIEGLREDIQATLDAPRPSAQAKANVRQVVEALAERGRPSIDALLETDYPFSFAASNGEDLLRVRLQKDNDVDLIATLCWLMKDALIGKVSSLIDEVADDSVALTADQRRTKIAKLESDILEAERIEEAIIEEAISNGLQVERRSDMDPRAILGLM